MTELTIMQIIIYIIWGIACFLFPILYIPQFIKNILKKINTPTKQKKQLLSRIKWLRLKSNMLQSEYRLICNNKFEIFLLRKMPNCFRYIKNHNYVPMIYPIITSFITSFFLISSYCHPKIKVSIFTITMIIIITTIIVFITFMVCFGALFKINEFFNYIRYNLVNTNHILLAYCVFIYFGLILVFMNNSNLEISIPFHNFTLIYMGIMLLILYLLTFKILINLIFLRYHIIKNSNENNYSKLKKFTTVCIIVIIMFICTLCLLNLILFIYDAKHFNGDNVNCWNIIYYSISTFITFCAENITAITKLSQFICLLSKFTTIFSITILLSVIISLLPNDDI
ncbi:hypothetical protein B1A67_00575 [Clostridium botulinum D/C]|nr:hypothetical protein B1A66_00530 [Clostridium botulinum D/C]OOV58374.1 hypothetical protein B0673_02740 [Clostridium botulinum D/C]OOV59563.1 hypothetical protein B1A67_00575 [Clostridium botulinum D/C]